MEYVGDMVDHKEFRRRFDKSVEDGTQNFYFLSVNSELFIDASVHGNEARFVNHSCEPNCSAVKWEVGGQTRIVLRGSENIPKVIFEMQGHNAWISGLLTSFFFILFGSIGYRVDDQL